MAEYQVLARKYRPKSFREVLGQSAIVTTLKNAIKFNRLAHAYLFCGSRGTGKTTLARLFAKALNCQQPTEDFEPCNQCASCREITGGHSLDVLEIDGASNRGIDDIRQINETVGYAAASGKYKIYIIDEVHMLTKEAFNALLKTLEEPPPKVKFFFATTEPHKVLPTILSRCQRFNLNRIPTEEIVKKLSRISQEMNVAVQEEALQLIATMADGGLRDAESLFDQILAFHEGEVTVASVASILGVMPRDCFFELDRAGKEGNLAMAFTVAEQVFSEGKDLTHFVEGLVEHFRHLITLKVMGKEAPIVCSKQEREKYEASAKLYTQEQCLNNLEYLIEAQNQIRFMPSSRIALESILLRVMRSHQRLPIEFLVRRLSELEQAIQSPAQAAPVPVKAPEPMATPPPPPPPPEIKLEAVVSVTEDPTPTAEDLGEKPAEEVKQPIPVELGAHPTPEATRATAAQSGRHDTLMHFAAVTLEGTIQKTMPNQRR